MDNSSRDRIVDRVRKLLNLAANDAAAEGEIKNAMQSANDLMLAYQIEQHEIEQRAAQDSSAEQQPETYGLQFTKGKFAKGTGWECTLCWAIVNAIGSIGFYSSKRWFKVGLFDKEERAHSWTFYGPEADVALAIQLFNEWANVIATMATGRYGSPVRGAGRNYAMGFADALNEIARSTRKFQPEYAALPGRSSTELVSLNQSLAVKQQKAKEFLKTKGITLRTGGGYTGGGGNAYGQGKSDGSRSGFGVSRNKALGAGR